MKNKILLCTSLVLAAFSAQAKNEVKWENITEAESGKYSFISTVNRGENQFNYRCSVFKFNESNFGKVESVNVDLDLRLEEDKLNFQENYGVNFVFSNGKSFKNNLKLNHSEAGLDRFTLYLNDGSTDIDIIENLSYRNYVNVEVSDSSGQRVLHRFYLNNSFKSIKKTQKDCFLLYETFK